MQVANHYRTEAAFKKAEKRYGTWSAIIASLPPTREARTGSTRPPKAWDRILFDVLGHVIAGGLLDREGHTLAKKLYRPTY